MLTRRAPVVTRVPSATHLYWVLLEAKRVQDIGDHQAARANLLHAVFVAATDGPGNLSQNELIGLLSDLGHFDVVPGSGE